MRVITRITLRIGTPGAYETVPPGSTLLLAEQEAQSLIERGIVAATHDPVVHQPMQPQDLLDAIMDAIDDISPDAYGKDGKPSVKAIEDILGQRVSAADRDKAWDVYQGLTDAGQ